MGNFLSLRGKTCWRVSLEGIDNFSMKISYEYDVDSPQTVEIAGPSILEVTIAVDNAEIRISDQGHRVSVIGDNNNIVVNGDGVAVRAEGKEIKLSGTGQGTTLYSDDLEAVSITDMTLSARENTNSVDAPPILPLLRTSTADGDGDNQQDENSTNRSLCLGIGTMLISYRHAQRNGDDDSETNDSNDSNNGGQKRDPEDPEEEDEQDKKRVKTDDTTSNSSSD